MNKITYLCFAFFISFSASILSSAEAHAFTVQRVRIEFHAPDGMIRPLLLGFTTNDAATDGIDNGYDAFTIDPLPNDLNFLIESYRFTVQGVGHYETSKIYPLGMYIENSGPVKIRLRGLENFESEIPVYIYDALLDEFYHINDKDMSAEVEAGEYTDRFYITFNNNPSALNNSNLLSTKDNQLENFTLKYNSFSKELVVSNGTNTSLKNISLFDFSGKLLTQLGNTASNEIVMPTNNLRTRTLLLAINFEDGTHITKSIALSD